MKLLMIFVGIFILILGAGRIWARAAKPPHLGVKNGLLSILPDTPNCVSTQDGSSEQRMAPMPYSGSQSDAQQKLLGIITILSRCAIQEEKPGYIWVVYRSMVFGVFEKYRFIDGDGAIHIAPSFQHFCCFYRCIDRCFILPEKDRTQKKKENKISFIVQFSPQDFLALFAIGSMN